MENAPSKVIYIVVGLILTLLVCAFGFFIFRTVKATGDDVATQVQGKMTAALESQWTQYDGSEATGASLVSLINDTYSGTTPVYITVKTNLDTTGKTYCYTTALAKIASATESTLVSNAKDSSKSEYINPGGKFVGSVIRNANNAIIGVEFTQK